MKYALLILFLAFTITSYSQLSVFGGARYQLDQKFKLKQIPTSGIKQNFSVHLSPKLGFEYQFNRWMAGVELNYFEGEGYLTYHSHGLWNFQTGPPYSYRNHTWSYHHEYAYGGVRFKFGYQFITKSWFHLDIAVFSQLERRLRNNTSDHVYIKEEGTTDFYYDSTYYPGSSTTSTSYDPFQLLDMQRNYGFIGLNVSPSFIVWEKCVLGLEFDVKFQWFDRMNASNDHHYYPSPYYDYIAFDVGFKVGYKF